jgi:hypothetical protein
MAEAIHHPVVPEFICEFGHEIETPDDTYSVRLYGIAQGTGIWDGWLIFFPERGGALRRTDRETEQGSRQALSKWAVAVTPTYLEGAFARSHPFREAEPATNAMPSAET